MAKLFRSVFIALMLSIAPSVFAGEPFAVVELFTSEGCSSCPSADAFLSDLTAEAQKKNAKIYTLGFHVDYWDDLGWIDPFSQESFTDRQRAYANINNSKTVYTPQMVVNGKSAFSGNSFELAQQAINLSLSSQSAAELKVSKLSYNEQTRRLSISYITSGDLKNTGLKVAIVEKSLVSDVKRGENAGQRLRHTNTVRKFESRNLTDQQGIIELKLPSKMDIQNASLVAFLQDSKTLVILAADGFDL